MPLSLRKANEAKAERRQLRELEKLKARKCRLSFAYFVQCAWDIVEPAHPLIWGWHMQAVCDHLQAVTEGRIKDLLINIPPGHSKSLLTAVLWPVWEWISNPSERTIFATHSDNLTLRDAMRRRDLIRDEWFRDWFMSDWDLSPDQRAKHFIKNTAKGEWYSTSFGSKITGFRGNKTVVDDPIDAQDAMMRQSVNAMADVEYIYSKILATRFNDPRQGKRVVIMQRLHENDLSDWCIKNGFTHLNLATYFEPENRCVTYDVDGEEFWRDPRQEEGELLFPELFDAEVIKGLEKSLAESFAAQHQQRPAPADGLIFKAHTLRFWIPEGVEVAPMTYKIKVGDKAETYVAPQMVLPKTLDRRANSWDMAFKKSEGTDMVAGGDWGKKGPNSFLLNMVCKRMDFVETVQAVLALKRTGRTVGAVVIEDKANGPAVISQLKKSVPGMIAYDPGQDSKIARAQAVTPFFEAGNIWLPHPALFPWVHKLVDHLLKFPKAELDDDVDQLTQMLAYWYLGKATAFRPAVAKKRSA